MKKENWIWMPHTGHFICGNNCRFHLATYVGNYIVSTVGELVPPDAVREISAKCRGIVLEGRGDARLADWLKKHGFEEIGCGRTYETMVFKAKKSKNKCCPYTMTQPTELDSEGYNSEADAFKGHYRLCKKWAKKKALK